MAVPTSPRWFTQYQTQHKYIAKRASAQSALLASALLALLTFIAFIVSHTQLQQAYGIHGTNVALQIATALLAAGGGCIVLAAVISRQLRRNYIRMEDDIYEKTRKLEHQYAKDRTILESIHHGILVFDTNGIVVDANPVASVMIGYPVEKFMGMSVEKALPLMHHQKDIPKEEHPVWQCVQATYGSDLLSGLDMNIRQTTNTFLPVALTVSPITRHKATVGAVAIFRDATEERRIDYLKSDFISLASHQLRTPISTVSWYMELMLEEKDRLSSEQIEYLTQVTVATRRMTHIIDALLRTTRLEGDNLKPEVKSFDVVAMFKELCGERIMLKKKRQLSYEEHFPEGSVMMEADPVLLRIILHNFLTNAERYTKDGGKITASLEDNGGTVVMHVEDTGIGIPREEQQHICKKLFRARNAVEVCADGNGLGLYISKMIAENLGGSLSFKSEEGKGSVFTIALPKKCEVKHNGTCEKM